MPRQQPLNGIAQILEQVPPVCDLYGFRRALPDCLCIRASAVSGNDPDLRMPGEPGGSVALSGLVVSMG